MNLHNNNEHLPYHKKHNEENSSNLIQYDLYRNIYAKHSSRLGALDSIEKAYEIFQDKGILYGFFLKQRIFAKGVREFWE